MKTSGNILVCRLLLLGILGLCLTACTKAGTAAPERVYTPEKSYAETVQSLAARRTELARRYAQAAPPAKSAVLRETGAWLRESLDKELFPHWYGTQWDFYGTTQTPRSGKIACGYFVTTLLRDAGFQLERARLAQQASEKIILSLVRPAYVQRFRNTQLADFVAAVKQKGAGLYVVGLDFHVGFILHDGREVFFVHSSYGNPQEVVKEIAAESAILGSSKYRVLGVLTADEQLLAKLLIGSKINTLR